MYLARKFTLKPVLNNLFWVIVPVGPEVMHSNTCIGKLRKECFRTQLYTTSSQQTRGMGSAQTYLERLATQANTHMSFGCTFLSKGHVCAVGPFLQIKPLICGMLTVTWFCSHHNHHLPASSITSSISDAMLYH